VREAGSEPACKAPKAERGERELAETLFPKQRACLQGSLKQREERELDPTLDPQDLTGSTHLPLRSCLHGPPMQREREQGEPAVARELACNAP
jgi:hypothetical protein